MTVTKERIIKAVNESAGLSKKVAREAVETIMAIIKKTLAGEEDLLVSGFGKFHVRRKRARRGRNPITKEPLELRPRRVVVFSTSGILRSRLGRRKS